jgi:O-antigen ligase
VSVIRTGISLLVAFAVLAHGAVEVWSVAILETGAAALFLLWGILMAVDREQEIVWSPLNWPLLGLLAIALAQLGFGWTAYAYQTRADLLRVTAYLLLFFLATQAFREKREIRIFVWFLLFLGFGVGLFAIIQYFTFNGKIYWLRELTAGGNPFGPFVNRNHFAGFMEMVVPLGLSLLVLRGTRRDLVPMAALFSAVCVGSLILSASRGGITVLVFELAMLALLGWVQKRGKARLGAVVVVLLAAGAMVAWLGVGQVVERFAQMRPGEITSARRVGMVKDSWRIFLDHPWRGAGLGTLGVVYPQYESVYDGKMVEHSHNDYIEGLAETGIPGAICGIAFLAMLLSICFSRLSAPQGFFSLAVHAGALVACAGLLVHSFVDFNLHIPSNATLFLLQAALATSAPIAQEIARIETKKPGGISVVDRMSRSGS